MKLHVDSDLKNADWPKRTPDTFADLGLDEKEKPKKGKTVQEILHDMDKGGRSIAEIIAMQPPGTVTVLPDRTIEEISELPHETYTLAEINAVAKANNLTESETEQLVKEFLKSPAYTAEQIQEIAKANNLTETETQQLIKEFTDG